MLLGFLLAFNFGCTLSALRLGAIGKTAVLCYTMPFWVLVFAWLALHERLSRWQMLAVATSLSGLLVLVQPWNFASGLAASMPAGMAGLGTLASPIVGVLAAWLQLGEYPTPVEAIGMGLIGVALVMLAWSPEASGRVSTG